MNLKGSNVIGLKITSAKDQQELGKIKDIIYDPNENKVIALLISEGDILAEPRVVLFEEIKEITKERVQVKSDKSIKPGSEAIKPQSTDKNTDTYMQGTTILNEGGEKLGKERDIHFDTKTGQVQSFEVLLGNQVREVKFSSIVSSTDSTTIIKEGDPEQSDTGFMGKIKQVIGK